MIWGNVKYIDHYKGISHALDVALDYLAAGDFKELENGKLDLEAGVFVKLLDQGPAYFLCCQVLSYLKQLLLKLDIVREDLNLN